MNSGKIFMNVVMLAIFAVMVGVATQYPPQARFMPLVIGIPGIVLCLLQLFLEFRESRRPQSAAADTRSEFERAQEEVGRIVGRKVEFDMAQEKLESIEGGLDKASEGRREIVVWVYFIGFVVGLIVFGFWVAIPVFLAVFLRYYAEESWLFALSLSAGTTMLLFLLFEKGLSIILHRGFITQYLLDRFLSS